MRQLKIIFSLILFASINIQAQNNLYLVPNPQEVVFRDGMFGFEGEISVNLYLNDKEEEVFQFGLLQKEFNKSIGGQLVLGSSNVQKQITIGIKGGGRTFNRLVQQLSLIHI